MLTGKKVPTLIPQQNDLSLGLGASSLPEPPSPISLYKKIPLGLSNLIMDCVKESPKDRPGSMLQIVARLDEMIRTVVGK